MTRLDLERRQVLIYLAAVAAGLVVGLALPRAVPAMESLVWPALIVLLYVTFVQVPLLHLREAFTDRRFMAAALIGNFVMLPLVVAGLLNLLPIDPVLRMGVVLVLLVPCTDWFITFSQLGRGDVPRAIALTPLNLLLQLLLLPVFLWLMADAEMAATLSLAQVAPALAIVLVPLALATVSEYWIEARPGRAIVRETLAWWPVPLLALVVFLVAAAQVAAVGSALDALPSVVPVFVIFLIVAALLARLLAGWLRLPADQGRTLAFSLGTRNSFVVLPFALTLPQGWEVAAVVVVIQSLVELLGMAAYLRWIPGRLFPDPPSVPSSPKH